VNEPERGQGPDARGQLAEVVELLPSAAYRLRLENEDVVIAHTAGAAKTNFVRLRPGDRVRVEISPRDKTRGRIVELLKTSS
jgi:translation initiation factor IF-1